MAYHLFGGVGHDAAESLERELDEFGGLLVGPDFVEVLTTYGGDAFLGTEEGRFGLFELCTCGLFALFNDLLALGDLDGEFGGDLFVLLGLCTFLEHLLHLFLCLLLLELELLLLGVELVL